MSAEAPPISESAPDRDTGTGNGTMDENGSESAPESSAAALTLLRWYDRHRRRFPWRALPGETADSYRVWLSEIMLQQTGTATAAPYFEAFLARWPTLDALAAASLDDVLQQWAGLGYYARARNLHACAQTVVRDHDGRLPDDEAALRTLPGIGDYTAAAIAAIAFDRVATPVDGNVERVVARLFAVETPLPQARPELRRLAATLTPTERPGDFAQAMMDLGATLCSPRAPSCLTCPWCGPCRARRANAAEDYPSRPKKPPKPTRRGVAFFIRRPDGMVLLRKRPKNGLLGGMTEIPSSDWSDAPLDLRTAQKQAPLVAQWRRLDGVVRHSFTHFNLELIVLSGRTGYEPAQGEAFWSPLDDLTQQALPSVMRKIIHHALGRPKKSG